MFSAYIEWQMRLKRFPLYSLSILLGACAGSSTEMQSEGEGGQEVMTQFANVCVGDVYVSGTVDREFSNTSWNEPFVATDDAHVRMQLTTFLFDGPATVIAEREVVFPGLPFEYAMCGDAAAIEALRRGELSVSVDIYNHAGVDGRVGDLVNEYLNLIDGPTNGLDIRVTGLEHCDAAGAGGFCTRIE